MNFKNADPVFSVYVHTSPHGKRYVGITSQPVEVRWGTNGKGYVDNKHFYAAISKYGWNNFNHEVVASGLDLEQASQLESELIAKYNCMDSSHGYNQTTGGNWSQPSDAVRARLSEIKRGQWKDEEFRRKVVYGNKIAVRPPLSPETKAKIGAALRGRVSPLRGRKLSESHRLKLLGRTPWNKGQTKHTSLSLACISKKLKGRTFTSATIEKMSKVRKDLYASGYSPIWVNDGCCERQIQPNELVPQGFKLGRLDTMYVTDGVHTRKVSLEEGQHLLANGWCRGKSENIQAAVKQSHQQYIWVYNELEFSNAVDLAKYLNQNGYPKIVGSTITALYNKGFSTSKIYCSLDGQITRKEVVHESCKN